MSLIAGDRLKVVVVEALAGSLRWARASWLLAMSMTAGLAASPGWQTHDGYRAASLEYSKDAAARPGFARLDAAAIGIGFTNRLSEERSLTNQVFLNGSGVAAGDVDGDGLCDLYFCGLDSSNRLYRNLGDWRFEDITGSAGVGCEDQASTGAALADLDGDGDLDLLVNGIARGTRLFLNDGHGRFSEVTETSGLKSASGATTLAIGDVDGDGGLDVYVVNYRSDTMRDMPGIAFTFGITNGVRQLLTVDGRRADAPDLAGRFTFDREGGVLENGEADALYLNRGGGRVERVPWTGGAFVDEQGKPVSVPYDWGLTAMFRDLNGDGAPDLYVCNDFQSPDRIWLNDGSGKFRAIPRAAIRQTSLFSMGVDFSDIDRDGLDDIFVADMLSREHVRRQVQVMNGAAFAQSRSSASDRPQYSRNTLFRNRGNGTYAEIAQMAGIDASDWTWCPAFLDVDLDGYEDLLMTTGHWRDAQDADAAREIDSLNAKAGVNPRDQLRQRRRFPRLATPSHAFRNRGDLTFEEVSDAWGFGWRGISQGMALADLDNDGDLDVAINCLNDGPRVLRNQASRARIAVRLRGMPGNTRGIGARLRVFAPGLPLQTEEMICGGRYLSSDDPIRVFAGGAHTNLARIEVAWRSGRVSSISNAPVDCLYEIDEAAGRVVPRESALAGGGDQPFFTDRSRILGHQHVDLPFDDFARQPLLPHTLSQPGPAVAWFDFNGDGWEDLLVGAGRGGRLAAFRSDGQGGFIPQKAEVLQTPADRDLTGVVCWRPNPGDLVLLLGLDSYEASGSSRAAGLRRISLVTGVAEDVVLPGPGSSGPLAMGDYDGDGDLDLFVGGRVIPGRYPEAATSTLLRNEAGRLVVDVVTGKALDRVGLVQAATFTDLDADGHPELVLACDWGGILIFRFEGGALVRWDPPLRWPTPPGMKVVPSVLGALTGWWNSIGVGDFDGDGRLDLIAGNWGRNTARQAFLQRPIRMHYAEFEPGGPLTLLESHFDAARGEYVPFRDRAALGAGFPSLIAAFPTFARFGAASLSEVLGTGIPPSREVKAATLDSILLLNRGDAFEVRSLPDEAQVSPVFGIAVGDFDGDGNEDIVLAQNFFGTSSAESRHDAGCGGWLRGDGTGGFAAVPQGSSGLEIDGEGRGAAVCDFDHDGRLDLVFGQNRGVTRLFRNIRARQGIRVVLKGDPENPQAVGARVRLEFTGGRLGPVHEVRMGGGYWSQDSCVSVLAAPEHPAAISVQWPRGPKQRVPIIGTEREFELAQPPR